MHGQGGQSDYWVDSLTTGCWSIGVGDKADSCKQLS